MLRIVLTACILTAGALAAQTVEGRVTNTATGDGIPDVSVGLLGMGQTAYRATTDATGRFRIEGVKDGSYTPFYKAANFWPARDGASPTFHMTAGAGPMQLQYEMYPIGKISGRVLDATGKPVPNASLQFTQTSQSGAIMMTLETNDKGEYSSPESMRPGAWTIAATAPPAWNPPEPRDGQRLGWAQTFYPSATDPVLAVKVEAPAGGELSKLDIKLAAAPVYRIRGVVLDADGNPAPKVSVELSSAGMGALRPPGPQRDTGDDGAFEFESVVDGEFRLSSSVSHGGVKQGANQLVEVKGRDLENVKLRLALPFSIQGKIVMEVPEGASAPNAPDVIATSAESGGGSFDGLPDGKGGFTIRNLYPGFYRIEAILPRLSPSPHYLDSIRLGGIDVPASGVQILSGALPLVVTYKRDGGTVRGTVEGCGDGAVYLIPQDPALRSYSFIQQASCGPNGRFEINAVRPGEYYGLAAAKDSRIPLSPMNLDQSLISQSVRVTVRPNEATVADLRLITR